MEISQKYDGLIRPITMRNITMVMEKINVANQSILESCSCSILRLDDTGNITYISEELCQLTGLQQKQLMAKPANTISPVLTQLLQSSTSVDITSADEAHYHFTHTRVEDPDHSGEIHIFNNITTVLDLYSENQRLKEEARQLQLIDQDTSLLTKRALLLILESQVSRCRRYETPLSIIMLDLGGQGDSADMKLKLLKLSRLLKDQLRWSDMIARSADNQFTVILPETERQDTMALINKLKEITSAWDDNDAICFGSSVWKKGINASDILQQCESDLKDNINAMKNGQDVA